MAVDIWSPGTGLPSDAFKLIYRKQYTGPYNGAVEVSRFQPIDAARGVSTMTIFLLFARIYVTEAINATCNLSHSDGSGQNTDPLTGSSAGSGSVPMWKIGTPTALVANATGVGQYTCIPTIITIMGGQYPSAYWSLYINGDNTGIYTVEITVYALTIPAQNYLG